MSSAKIVSLRLPGFFDKQIDLMRSLRVYRDNNATKESMKDLPEENVVTEILEPLSNKQRLQMLKAL